MHHLAPPFAPDVEAIAGQRLAGGNAAQMLPLAEAIAARGLMPVIVDMPAHGRSRGRTSALPQFARAIDYVAARLQQQGSELRALVAHSLGANAAAYATSRGLAAQRLVAMIGDSADSADVIATAVALTAASIASSVRRFVAEPCGEMVVSGGGAHNPALIDALRQALLPTRLTIFDELYYDAEAKEAVAFALLGYLHVERRAGNVIGATGARGPRVLGKLTPA